MISLSLNRNGTYYARCPTPKDLMDVNSPKEIYLSLQTKSLEEAKQTLRMVESVLISHFNFLRSHGLPFRRKRSPLFRGDVMHNLIASLSFDDAEIIVKSKTNNFTEFQNILSSINAIKTKKENKNAPKAIDLYVKYAQGVGENLKPSSISVRQCCIVYLRVLFGNRTLEDFDRNTVMSIKENLFKLPLYLQNKTFYERSLSINEIPENCECVSWLTVNRLFQTIKSFFRWCISSGYCETNPFEHHKIYCKAEKTKVTVYTKPELDLLFNDSSFIQWSRNLPSRFWVPLICLHTGARRGEILSLEVNDVIVDKQGQLYLNIRKETVLPKKIKPIKNTHSVRIVPVPQKIIDWGFVDYLNIIKSEGYPVLFPDVHINKDGTLNSRYIGYTFIDYRRELGITGKKTFHSLRHNAITCLSHQKCSIDDIKQLVGHAYGNITLDVYGEPKNAQELIALVNKIDFQLKIPMWKDSDNQRKCRKRGWLTTCKNLDIAP